MNAARRRAASRATRRPASPTSARVLRAGVRIVAPVRAAIDVGQRRDVHPVRRALAARARVLVRTDVDERRRVAVVRRLEHDHVALPVYARASRSASSFASLAEFDEVADVAAARAASPSSRSAYSVEQVVQVARVRVEHAHLRSPRHRRRADDSARRAARCCTRRGSGDPRRRTGTASTRARSSPARDTRG